MQNASQNTSKTINKNIPKTTLDSVTKIMLKRLPLPPRAVQKVCFLGGPLPGTAPGPPRDTPRTHSRDPPPRQGKGRDGEPIPFDSTCLFLGWVWFGMGWVVAWVWLRWAGRRKCDDLTPAGQKASHTPGRRILFGDRSTQHDTHIDKRARMQAHTSQERM